MFIELLSAGAIVSFDESLTSNSIGPIKCISLNNQPCQAKPKLLNINSNQSLFYPFTVSFNKCSIMCSIKSKNRECKSIQFNVGCK